MQKIKLTDLIDVEVLQRIQDGFSKYSGLSSLTTDENGVPVTKGSSFTDFCINHVRKSELGVKRCKECDKMGAYEASKRGCAATYICHAGLIDFSAPIMVEGQVIGSFLGGQVRTKEFDEDSFRASAEELGMDADEYVEAAKKVCVLDRKEVEKAADFLAEIAKVLSEMAYQNYVALQTSKRTERAARSQASYIMNSVTNLGNNMKEWTSLIEDALASDDLAVLKQTLADINRVCDVASTDIHDTLEYIRLSGGEAILRETEYDIQDVMTQIQDAIPYGVNVVLAEDVPNRLMGDAGRIVMLFVKILQLIVSHTQNAVTMEVKSHKSSYSTWLDIRIKDFQIDKPEETLECDMEQLVVQQMNGTLEFHCDELDKMYVQVCLPQLAIEGE
nr:PocR ligand-binding domain-containing protein [Eubacterium sp.]